jgi:hypothetical protein
MDILGSLAVVALAGLLHASFQLSVSVLTLLSGHSLGAKRSQSKILRLTTGFVFGSGIMTLLLLSLAATIFVDIYDGDTPDIIWAMACGLTLGVAVSVWLFYYRREKGTSLWIPRGVANYLNARTKATKSSAESFTLGMMSVLGELLFVAAPLIISALVLVTLPQIWQLAGIGIYAVFSSLSLVVVWVLLGSGRKISQIQKWRENNKYFLQFAAGSGLVILGFYTYVTQVVAVAAGGA